MATTAAEIRYNNIISKMDSKIPSAGAGRAEFGLRGKFLVPFSAAFRYVR